MADETLVSAARRVCRFFNIDMNKGGLITEATEQAVETLDAQWRIAVEKEKLNSKASAEEPAVTEEPHRD